jgi:hypothetical protein
MTLLYCHIEDLVIIIKSTPGGGVLAMMIFFFSYVEVRGELIQPMQKVL